ncbi:MAG TPA: fumarylacetoacetate hydrolase family protein [Beijerinckiaceae bacterium]|nr:fumarylacetoacetate hydrolase family protein [Beijerinckiaceae bacterium]
MPNLASLLIAARRSGDRLRLEPGVAPDSIEAAYAVQAAVADGLGARVAGWKVGISPEGAPFAAPILDCDLHASGARVNLGAGEPAKIEIELALRLGRDLGPRPQPYAREDILDATNSVLVGMEIVANRLQAPQSASFEALLADNFNNGGYVAGDETSAFRALALEGLRVRLWVESALAQDKIGSHPMGDPLIPAMAWASRQCDRLGGLRAGQFVTTGTLTIPFPVAGTTRLEGRIEGIGAVAAGFEIVG